MKTLYLDLYVGVSGDMLLGLLVDLGLEARALAEGLHALGLPGLTLTARDGLKGAIGGTKVDVVCPDQAHDRHLSDVRRIIQDSTLSDRVKERAVRVFTRLAYAEAHVHRIDVEQVHFHEVGALDAIADIVGFVLGLELLGVERLLASPLPLGRGFVNTAHGRLPVPAPAVLELAREFPSRQLEFEAELSTPTGAALVTTLAQAVERMPLLIAEKVGYGLGTRDLPVPNAVRGVLGRAGELWDDGVALGATPIGADRVLLVEANIDDLNPQVYGYLSDQLFAAGALDVWLTAIQMKKGRPGTKLSVLAEQGLRDRVAEIVFRETSTLGLRMTTMDRLVLPRELVEVETRYGRIRAKVAGGRVAPEYDDCAKAAADHKVALRDVWEEVRARATDGV